MTRDDDNEDRRRKLSKRSQADAEEDDDSDDDDELVEQTDDPDYDEEFAEKVFDVTGKNYLQIFWTQALAVLMHPKKFFAAMPPQSVGSGFLFLTIAAMLYASAQGIAKMNAEAFILCFLSSLFFTSMGSFFVFVLLGWTCKGKGTLGQTFRVLAFSKAPLLFAWITLGPLQIGGIISMVFTLYLNIVGLTKIHRVNKWLVIVSTLILSGAGFLFKLRTGLS